MQLKTEYERADRMMEAESRRGVFMEEEGAARGEP